MQTKPQKSWAATPMENHSYMTFPKRVKQSCQKYHAYLKLSNSMQWRIYVAVIFRHPCMSKTKVIKNRFSFLTLDSVTEKLPNPRVASPQECIEW